MCGNTFDSPSTRIRTRIHVHSRCAVARARAARGLCRRLCRWLHIGDGRSWRSRRCRSCGRAKEPIRARQQRAQLAARERAREFVHRSGCLFIISSYFFLIPICTDNNRLVGMQQWKKLEFFIQGLWKIGGKSSHFSNRWKIKEIKEIKTHLRWKEI